MFLGSDTEAGSEMMSELSDDDEDGGSSVSMADVMDVAFFNFLS